MLQILIHEPDSPQTNNGGYIWSLDLFQDVLTFLSSLGQIAVLVSGPLV